MKPHLLIPLLCLLSSVVTAQTDSCIINLKSAGTAYDQGDYDHAIATLNITLKGCNLSKNDQIEANKLLILCYLQIDKLEAANSIAATIMKIDPTYAPDKTKDDPRLSSLFQKFKPESSLAVSISGGLNIPQIVVVRTYSVVHPDDAPGLASYKSVLGYQLKAAIEKRAYKKLWVELGFQFRNSNYNHTLDSVQNTTILYHEKLTYLDFPLSAKYHFLSHSFTPYLQAGADFSFLLQGLSTTERDNEKDLVDRTALRDNLEVGYFGAAGVRYAVKGFRLFGSIGYVYFPHLVNKTGTRYADEINLYKYYYVDDDFKMNNIQFNAGVSYILAYKIIKVE